MPAAENISRREGYKNYSMQSLRNDCLCSPGNCAFQRIHHEEYHFWQREGIFQDVQNAARLAVAEKFIKRLPSEYSFNVGSEGINLSVTAPAYDRAALLRKSQDYHI